MLCPPCASVSPFKQKEAAWKGSRGGRTGSGLGQGRVRGTRKKKTQHGKKTLLSLCASVAASTRRASCHTCTLQALAGFGWTRCQVLQLEPLVLRCSRHGPVAEGWASPSRGGNNEWEHTCRVHRVVPVWASAKGLSSQMGKQERTKYLLGWQQSTVHACVCTHACVCVCAPVHWGLWNEMRSYGNGLFLYQQGILKILLIT